MPGVLTDADLDDLVRRYLAGETGKQLMATFHIGYQSFVDALTSRGVTIRSRGVGPRLTIAQADELVARYIAGESTKTLGPAYGLSTRVVSDYLRRAGVQARPRHHALQAAIAAMDPEVLAAKRTAAMKRRWAAATPEQRRQMTAAAHDAVRGVPVPMARREAIAASRERRSGSDSPYETLLAQWLTERGVPFTQQVAVGPYCADFAVGSALVEVTTGWARKKEWSDRFTRFFNEGWDLYVVWHDTRVPLLPVVADDLVAWVERLQRTPPEGCEHRVVWRSRQVLSAGRADGDYVAGVLKSATPRGHWPLYDGAGEEAQ